MDKNTLKNLILSRKGYKIGKKGKLIYIKDEKTEQTYSPKTLDQIIISTRSSITTDAIIYLKEQNVDILILSRKGYFRIINVNKNPLKTLWKKQLTLKKQKKLKLSKEIITSAIYNKKRLLLQLKTPKNKLEKFDKLIQKTKESNSKETIFGLEGTATRYYYKNLKEKIPQKYEFKKRNKNPPTDPINSMLSYGYTILQSKIHQAIIKAKLTPYLGIYHKSYREKTPLTYDLMEPFRHIIVDRTILTMINKKDIDQKDFKETPKSGTLITGESKNKLIDRLYNRMETKYKYKKQKRPFLDIFELQAQELAETIKSNKKYKAFKYR
ncbi:CRISPR-associated endonuclease Cas1 [Methanonatronarchaeum sp. AMET-Sl]|uniref:CRISPR-associated endonuclease Cas1 n=1 Tax=Methanonatronarchaeum sp. AMET-Sl TaxID=3037654 RepID=UPI00244E4301|nr:CRISPR-associated endonuclease Cas1 [Methanonatronarchaeum sp. AMET-Sl]WGI17156.1 CRISPR-associated endonuclease Cas1 [Methanonatronarchaeum sp. AMET-Sl]